MENVKTICNWTRIGGSEWSHAIQSHFVEDELVKPETDTILQDDRAILLRRKMKVDADLESGTCELQLSIFPRNKIAAFTLICTAPKIEIFIGTQSEYYETEYGCLLDECSVVENDNADSLRSYRYDVEIEKSGICEITLKFLTTSDEICIFAFVLQIAPNPNGITTQMPPAINLENVQKMLEGSNQKLTPNAEKCKAFLQMCSKIPMQKGLNSQATTSGSVSKSSEELLVEMVTGKLKTHVDNRLAELEKRVISRLDMFEAQQTAKIDEILKTIQSLKKD